MIRSYGKQHHASYYTNRRKRQEGEREKMELNIKPQKEILRKKRRMLTT